MTAGAARPAAPRPWPGPRRRGEDAALNATLNPTQLRLAIALVVTLVCLPLLVLDQVGGSGDGSSGSTQVETGAPEPSLVAAVAPPTTEAPATTTTAAPTTVAPPTTVAAAPATTTTTRPRTTTTTRPATTTTAAPYVAPATTTTRAPAPAPPAASGGGASSTESSFLACVRHRESRGVYTAVDPTGQFMGAYQIYQGGWDAVASGIGRGDLVGVPPHRAAPADQDAVALAMLRRYGTSPWGGSCG